MAEVDDLAELAKRAELIISVCPPVSALEVAQAVAATGFDGIYVDVNAISPATARIIGAMFGRFVDGGVIGPPVSSPGSTRLYLAGDEAPDVARRWAGTHLETHLVEGGAGAASAVKVCFAAWTKGTAALLLAVRALATAEGVEDSLLAEWATSIPHLGEQAELSAAGNAPKAWRFVGEMEEMAATFAAHDLPDGFGRAAADVYERLTGFKGTAGTTLPDVIEAINRGPIRPSVGDTV